MIMDSNVITALSMAFILVTERYLRSAKMTAQKHYSWSVICHVALLLGLTDIVINYYSYVGWLGIGFIVIKGYVAYEELYLLKRTHKKRAGVDACLHLLFDRVLTKYNLTWQQFIALALVRAARFEDAEKDAWYYYEIDLKSELDEIGWSPDGNWAQRFDFVTLAVFDSAKRIILNTSRSDHKNIKSSHTLAAA